MIEGKQNRVEGPSRTLKPMDRGKKGRKESKSGKERKAENGFPQTLQQLLQIQDQSVCNDGQRNTEATGEQAQTSYAQWIHSDNSDERLGNLFWPL